MKLGSEVHKAGSLEAMMRVIRKGTEYRPLASLF